MRLFYFASFLPLCFLLACPPGEDPGDCATYYPDVDGDGLGDPRLPVPLCDPQSGYVADGSDTQPDCATDDTDSCGVCAGGDQDLDCDGVCFGAAALDSCSVCSGGSTGLLPEANRDCADVCSGEAAIDVCGVCAGGTTGLAPSDPQSCLALPDFTANEDYLQSTLAIDYVDVGNDSCLIAEGCVGGTGLRKVLRFGTQIGNIGGADFELGTPPADGFGWDECHEHYHFDDYASYQLLDAVSGVQVTEGHKNGWCLMDSGVFDAEIAAAAGNDCTFYDCDNQGIGQGCQDTYHANLPCQWIDITGVLDGSYQVEVMVNPEGGILEIDTGNNRATATVEINGDVVILLGS
jgi:hypothetical protein